MEKKMTAREFFNAVIGGKVSDKELDYAREALAKLDAKNDKRKNTKSKEQIANDGIMNSIVEYIKTNGSQVASALGLALDISTQKASALCKILVEGGELTVADKKVKGKGSVKEYSLAPSDEVANEVAE
jgi:hypothetical protein